jgi:hypothetical protein
VLAPVWLERVPDGALVLLAQVQYQELPTQDLMLVRMLLLLLLLLLFGPVAHPVVGQG